MEEDEVNTSKKRKTINENVQNLSEKLNVALKRNEDLIKTFEQMKSQYDRKIDGLINENDSLRRQLQGIIKMHEEESIDSSDGIGSDVEEEMPVGQRDTNKEMTAEDARTENGAKRRSSKAEPREVGPRVNGPTPAASPVVTRKGSKSVPILTTYGMDVRNIIRSIDSALGHSNYNIKVLGKTVSNVDVCTLEDFAKVRKLLEERKISFYTYTPKGLRPFSVVIEGLPGSFESGEIEAYLNGLQIGVRILSLTKLGNSKWLLKMSRDSDIKKFYEIRYILHCKINIRKFIRRGVTQCFNCQRFGHVSLNCQMPYRCVKCAGSHGPGKCTVPRSEDNIQETLSTDPITGQITKVVGIPLRCANCGVEGHAASSKECPRRLELLRKLEIRKTSTGGSSRPRQFAFGKNTVTKGVSYAMAAGAVSVDRGLSNAVMSPRVVNSSGHGLNGECHGSI